jgi:hypothetical protein
MHPALAADGRHPAPLENGKLVLLSLPDLISEALDPGVGSFRV